MTNRFTGREQARRVYYGCVFKAKKEIPDKTRPGGPPAMLREVLG